MDNSSQSNKLPLNQDELLSRLVKASEKIDVMLSPRDIKIAGDPTLLWPEILKMPPDKQTEYVNRFELFTEICSDSVKEGYDLFGDTRLIWHALAKLKVKPPSDLFGKILDQDYIEIYDQNGIQVFRNFEFCKLISYTLHEILVYPWSELYGRDEKVMSQIMTAFGRPFSERKIISDLGVDTHVTHEHRSGSGRSFKVTMKYFSPLFGESNSVPYMLAGSNIERLT